YTEISMISYLNGKIIIKKDKFIILDVNGVGYKVFLSKKTLAKLPEIGEIVKVFCFLNVKENILDLYGFLNHKELEFFEILDNIRGVGPKAALEISSLGSLESIKQRILSKDETLFSEISGIGRKKAMTIILELTGKIKDISEEKKTKKTDEAEQGLVSLGFTQQQAKDALAIASKNIKGSEERIKAALKVLGK
ncbi:Holliday junction branch migration protein RuvA, partial [Patescibacteria group bacterium]|nr:Holliday junction branch migration protein RuvA [Patescibacteria group bacterium]